MAAVYRLGPGRRLINAALRAALWLDLAPRRYVLLTTRGRKFGRPRSTPVILLDRDDGRWLVAPYGARAWVKNARAAGTVALGRGRHARTLAIVEVGPAQAAPVLKDYLEQTPITRPFFDVGPEAPVEAFEREAARHPVFRLVKAT